MKEFNILTPGEKIKNIRSKFSIRQEDITGGDITRNLISIIEHNRANLTETVAKILVENINKKCKEKNIDFSVTEEYLLEDVVSQAKKIADEYIGYIDQLESKDINLNEEKLNEIELFLKTYDTEEKRVQIYRAVAKKFLDIKMYNKSFDYYLKAYESSTNDNGTTNILIKLGLCCAYLSQYDKAISYYKLLLELNKDIQPTYLAKYNIALCYKKLGKYKEALVCVEEIKANFKNVKPTHIAESEVDELMGICLYKLNSYNKAIKIYKGLLKDVQSLEQELLLLNDLADVYRETKDYDKLNSICTEIKSKLKNDTLFSEYESELYIGLSKNFIAIGDRTVALNVMLKALESYKNGKSTLYLEDVDNLIVDILKIYITDTDESNIDFIKRELFELVEKGLLPKNSKASLMFIQHYNNIKNHDKVNNIISFLAD